MKIEESILQQLDDHIVLTQSISFSPFKKPFENEIDEWESSLVLVSNIIEEWLKVQRQWMYLEPIFSSEDIKIQLPIESKRFDNVDMVYRKALGAAFATPQIIDFCSNRRLLDQFIESNRVWHELPMYFFTFLCNLYNKYQLLVFNKFEGFLELLMVA